MIERYTTKEMGKIWTEENKFQKMLEVEVFACEALAKEGEIPKSSADNIRKKAKFSIDRIKKIEEVTKHDIAAFVQVLGENVGKDGRFIHLGLTSSDVLDTGLAAQMQEASNMLLVGLDKLSLILKKQAKRYKYIVMIGRTHGVHAEPITFGLKLALWYQETLRNIERMMKARDTISVGKISGVVGTYANINPKVEQYVCKKMGLKPSPISTQVLQRDRHAEFLTTLAICAASIEKFATEIRGLQRTEVLEVEECFTKGQKGSSAMPHKRNPITCEQMVGLARVIRANAMVSLENIALWHERDISHSSAERIIIPDSTILLDYMLRKFTSLMENLLVYPENMKKNLAKTRNAFLSQRILLELIKKGNSRDQAYRIVQRITQTAWQKALELNQLLKTDPETKKFFTANEIDAIFDIKYYIRHVHKIFEKAGIK
ncbi:MAG: adenylosuccinate lyase [bacterium]